MSELIVVTGDEELHLKLISKSPERSAKEVLRDTLFHLEMNAKISTPQRTGNLMRSISKEGPTSLGDGHFVGSVSAGGAATAPYAVYVEKGTGIYGDKHVPIRAKTGNMLVWEEHGNTVFTRQVKGQKGQEYMQKAFIETRDVYLPARAMEESKKLAD